MLDKNRLGVGFGMLETNFHQHVQHLNLCPKTILIQFPKRTPIASIEGS